MQANSGGGWWILGIVNGCEEDDAEYLGRNSVDGVDIVDDVLMGTGDLSSLPLGFGWIGCC